jgi:uncharacterized membrane-anchored protein
MIRLPDHPLRFRLHDEINAHPYEPLQSPERVSYLAYLVDEQERSRELAHVEELCRHFGQTPPRAEDRHCRIVLGGLRVKIERHEEFTRYTFILSGPYGDPFADPAVCRIPAEWIERIPGKLLVAANAAVLPATADFKTASPEEAAAHFPGGRLIGSGLANGAVTAYTDFRIHDDGFSHWLLYDHCSDPNQVGRTLQRLLEIETYRMLALMAVPIVRQLRPDLKARDRQLVELTTAVAGGSEKTDEELLEDLTRLAADVENLVSTYQYRFDATRAYFGLVASRIGQLREVKIGELATLSGFLNRRLEPMRETCDSSMRWLNTLANRVTNASQLLRTRADVRREQQNHQLLAAMNRRSGLQLRLQQTVEGLSLAAITYAGASLLGILAGALFKRGLFPFDEPTMQAVAIPFVFVAAYLGTESIRRAAARDVDYY